MLFWSLAYKVKTKLARLTERMDIINTGKRDFSNNKQTD